MALICRSRVWNANNLSCANLWAQLSLLPVVLLSSSSSLSSLIPAYLVLSTFGKIMDESFRTQAVVMFITTRGKGIALKDYFYKVFIHVR